MRVSCIVREGQVQSTEVSKEYIWLDILPENGGEISLAFSTENTDQNFNFICSLRQVVNEIYSRLEEARHEQTLGELRKEFAGTTHQTIYPCQMGHNILPHVINFAWRVGWRPHPGPLLSVMSKNGEILDHNIQDDKDLELLPYLFEEAENYLNICLDQLKCRYPEEFSDTLQFSHHPDWGDWGLFTLDADAE